MIASNQLGHLLRHDELGTFIAVNLADAVLLTCRSSNEAPQESLMMQLSEEVAYLHQAYTLCLAMRDNLAAAMVASLLLLTHKHAAAV